MSAGRILAFSSVIAILGLCCVILPAYVMHGADMDYRGGSVVPWFHAGIDNVAFLPTWVLLLALGIGSGIIMPGYGILFGLSSVCLLPALLLLDVFIYPSSHNLWPIECLFYMFIGWPGIVGAVLGSFIGKRLRLGAEPDS